MKASVFVDRALQTALLNTTYIQHGTGHIISNKGPGAEFVKSIFNKSWQWMNDNPYNSKFSHLIFASLCKHGYKMYSSSGELLNPKKIALEEAVPYRMEIGANSNTLLAFDCICFIKSLYSGFDPKNISNNYTFTPITGYDFSADGTYNYIKNKSGVYKIPKSYVDSIKGLDGDGNIIPKGQELVPGCIVFGNGYVKSDGSNYYGHVGIYVGNGLIVHSTDQYENNALLDQKPAQMRSVVVTKISDWFKNSDNGMSDEQIKLAKKLGSLETRINMKKGFFEYGRFIGPIEYDNVYLDSVGLVPKVNAPMIYDKYRTEQNDRRSVVPDPNAKNDGTYSTMESLLSTLEPKTSLSLDVNRMADLVGGGIGSRDWYSGSTLNELLNPGKPSRLTKEIGEQFKTIGEKMKDVEDDYDLDSIKTDNFWERFAKNAALSKDVGLLPVNGYDLSSFYSIHGLPFQFTAEVDPRPKDEKDKYLLGHYGKYYASNYLYKTPIVNLIPGEPVFLPGLSDNKKNEILSTIINGTEQRIADVVGVKNVRYYGFKENMSSYYDYVNSMMRAHAIFLGLGNVKIDGTKTLATYDWFNFRRSPGSSGGFGSDIMNYYSGFYGEGFAYSPASDVTFSVDNSTGESAISSSMKTMSSKVREVQFLIGGISKDIALLDRLSPDDHEQLVANIKEMANHGLFKGDHAFQRMSKALGIVINGGNLLFPEIWRDSSTSGSEYTLEMHFRSPYADIISRLIYVMLPYYKLLAMAMPRSITETSFAAPFLVRAYSKGHFNIDCGIIGSINVKKYSEGGDIAEDMVPIAIDVTISIKDLYNTIHMTKSTQWQRFFNNSGFFNMLSTDAGMSFHREDALEKARIFVGLMKGSIDRTVGPHAIKEAFKSNTFRKIINFFTGEN